MSWFRHSVEHSDAAKGIRTRQTVVVGADALLAAARRLRDRGEISREQYAEMERRGKRLPEDVRMTRRIINVEEE